MSGDNLLVHSGAHACDELVKAGRHGLLLWHAQPLLHLLHVATLASQQPVDSRRMLILWVRVAKPSSQVGSG